MDITGDIARYSMDMAAARLSSAVQTSMVKNVMELQQDTMAQLLQTMGLGGSLNIQA
ncbi:MAG: YjfB family protein [Fretibacterium sp.]|nr:YjfB family protein [Fretibacterium sp.]